MYKEKSKILIIDDSESIQLLLKEILSDSFDIFFYFSPIKALADLRDNSYDCIILDLMLPEMSGIDFLEKFKKVDNETPVFVLTAKDCSEKEIAELFENGISDYVTKPFMSAELTARLQHHINLKHATVNLIKANNELMKAVAREEKLNQKIIDKTLALKNSITKIKVLNKKLKYFATHDKLTAFLNRRAFFAFLENDIKRLKRINTKLSLIMLDIDLFKNINDTYGHLMGDFILAEFAKLVSSNLRDIDLIGRFGGEEFLVLLADTSLETAMNIACKLKTKIEKASFIKDGTEISITASMGVAEYRSGEKTDEFVKRVDEALYKAKRAGRNAVVAANDTPTLS